jgi:hypothetical protein
MLLEVPAGMSALRIILITQFFGARFQWEAWGLAMEDIGWAQKSLLLTPLTGFRLAAAFAPGQLPTAFATHANVTLLEKEPGHGRKQQRHGQDSGQ